MKTSTLFILIFISISSSLAQKQTGIKMLNKYLQEKEFFKLEAAYKQQKNILSEFDDMYYGALIDNASNRCAESTKKIERLLNGSKLKGQTTLQLLKVQMDNAVKLDNYSMAARMGDYILSSYSSFLDATEIADIRNSTKLWRALENVAPQQTNRIQSSVKWTRDKIGLMNIPVRIGKETNDFVFDTGANLSTISLSYAKKLNMKILPTRINLSSSTSIQNEATLAVAPIVFIDKTALKNVVFLVLPDENLQFPQLDYAIHGIIGFPVMNQLKEVQITRDGLFHIPEQIANNVDQNLVLDGLTPIIQLKIDNDTLLCRFDTGALETELFKKYYEANKSRVEQEGRVDSIRRAGAGGTHKVNAYKMAPSTFIINHKKTTLSNFAILTESLGDFDKHFYGNIGQDIIGRFNKMTINFQSMYIDFD
ncbi:retropepsin-like aspartic protease [Olivibacter sp. CPCC 100613]|uniref:retropepsin-like aspartic protease n=1 Tax=Olivibacter sp. CPCC 100613 TaxID=3079931 RepID=UPI002FF92ED9